MTLEDIHQETRSERAMFRLRLVAGAALFFAVFRLTLLSVRDFKVMVTAWTAEAAVFLAIFLLAEVVAFLSRRASRLLFHGLFLVYFVITFSFCMFFQEAVWRQYSVLDTGPSGILYFFTNVLPLSGLFLLLGGLIGLYLLSWWIKRLRFPFVLAPSLLLVAIAVARTTDNPLDTPIIYIRNDIREAWNGAPVTVPPDASVPPALNNWRDQDVLHSPYRKIIVFVMESITLRELNEKVAALDEKSFLRRALTRSHHYSNLYAADMDSRTGMLALLTARFVPYEAYSDSDVQKYQGLDQLPSLVNLMHRSGYRTAFAASETEQEEVVYTLKWDEHFTLTEADRKVGTEKGYVCMVPYEFEHSCEDRFILDRLLSFVEKNDRVFLFQEFLYGHSVEYMDLMKVDPVAYYSKYMDEFAAGLQKRGLLQDTLIVVVSDHGIRLKGYEPWLSTYRLPLLFVHPTGDNREDSRVFSQIDFKDILLAEAGGNPAVIRERDFAPFMGMTGSSMVGAVTRDLDLILIKDRLWLPYVVKHSNGPDQDQPEGTPRNRLTPDQLLGGIRSYRACFASKC